MTTAVHTILEAAEQLSPIEQLEIINTLARRLQQHYRERTSPPSAPPRVLGLHAGKVRISDDFDSELPDAFWLGDDR